MIQKPSARRNETALLWQGIIFFLGLVFIDGSTVVSVFVSNMGGSLALAGSVFAIRLVPSVLAQVFLGVRSGGVRDLPRYVTAMMAVFYSLPLAASALLLSGISGGAALFAFLALYGLLWAGDGCIYIAWYDLYARVADPRRRGLILGLQQLFGGLLALAGGAVVGLVLGAEGLPVRARYAILFALAGLALGGSAIPMAFVRDARSKPARPAKSPQRFPDISSLLKASAPFRRMAAVQAAQGVATMAFPILILFSIRNFSLPLETAALLIPAQTAGTVAGGLLWGALSHRFGNRSVIRCNQANILLVVTLAATAAATGLAALAFPLALLSGVTYAAWMAYPNYVIDIAPERDRPQYLVLSSLVNLPFAVLPLLAGRFAEAAGFLPVFLICGLAAMAGFVLSGRLADAGRHG